MYSIVLLIKKNINIFFVLWNLCLLYCTCLVSTFRSRAWHGLRILRMRSTPPPLSVWCGFILYRLWYIVIHNKYYMFVRFLGRNWKKRNEQRYRLPVNKKTLPLSMISRLHHVHKSAIYTVYLRLSLITLKSSHMP